MLSLTKLAGRHITSKCDSDNPPDLGPWDRGRRPVAKLHPGCRPCRLQGGQPAWLLRKGVFCNIASKFWLYEDPCFTVWRPLFDLFLPKVVDHTYSRGEREEITTTVDIGIANECLAECTRLGSQCLAVTLQVQNTGKPFLFLRTRLQFSLLPQNERGGRQRCFSHTSSAGADGTDPSSSTGVTYYEKICQSMLIVACFSWSFKVTVDSSSLSL